MSYEDYTLNQSQKDHLQNLINSEQYDLGYRYISWSTPNLESIQ